MPVAAAVGQGVAGPQHEGAQASTAVYVEEVQGSSDGNGYYLVWWVLVFQDMMAL